MKECKQSQGCDCQTCTTNAGCMVSVLHEVDVMGTKDVIACCVRDVIQPFLSKWVPLTLVQAVFCLSEL